MGTSGTDKFHEYRDPGDDNSKKKGAPKKKVPSSGGGARGGSSGGGPKSGVNKCAESISNVTLEEVALCSYYGRLKAVPPEGTVVLIRRTLVQGRIGVVTENDETIGYLPVEYNYLRRCIEQGFSYSGNILFSSVKPIPAVRVGLSASQK